SFDFHEIAFAIPLLAFSLSALVRRRLRPAVLWALPLVFVKEDQGFTVAAIGLVIVGYGLAMLRAGRRGRAVPRPAPGGRPAGARHLDPGRGAAGRVGPGLVGAGDRGHRPALQPRASLPVLERRGSGRPRRPRVYDRAGAPAHAGGAREAVDHLPDPAAGRVPRAPVPGGARRGAQPGPAVHLHQQLLLGHGLALQRDRDAYRVPGRGGRHGRLARRIRAAGAPGAAPRAALAARPR